MRSMKKPPDLYGTPPCESTRPPGRDHGCAGGGAVWAGEGPVEEGRQGAGQEVPLPPAPPGATSGVTHLSVLAVRDYVMYS